MKYQFLHITFIFRTDTSVASIEKTLRVAKDWIRYHDDCWMIYTSKSADEWYDRIKKKISSNDSVLILGFDPNVRKGRMPKIVWDWLRKSEEQRGVIMTPK